MYNNVLNGNSRQIQLFLNLFSLVLGSYGVNTKRYLQPYYDSATIKLTARHERPRTNKYLRDDLQGRV